MNKKDFVTMGRNGEDGDYVFDKTEAQYLADVLKKKGIDATAQGTHAFATISVPCGSLKKAWKIVDTKYLNYSYGVRNKMLDKWEEKHPENPEIEKHAIFFSVIMIPILISGIMAGGGLMSLQMFKNIVIMWGVGSAVVSTPFLWFYPNGWLTNKIKQWCKL